jgi:hypothetical protein
MGPRVQRSAAREHHVVQRRRSDIEEWYRVRGVRSPFPERRADEQVVDLRRHPDMIALLDELKAYAGDLYGAATGSVDRWVAAHLQKRLLSSPAALRSSIDKRLAAVSRGLALDGGTVAVKLAEETRPTQHI